MIFEYWVNGEHAEEYGDLSKKMRLFAGEIDGFYSIEAFTSTSDPGKRLGLAYFRDEEAVRAWRNHPQHRRAQVLGRLRLLTDYRLVMASVVRDYGNNDRDQVPQDSLKMHISTDD